MQQSPAAVLYRIGVALLRLPVRLTFRPTVRGLEHLPRQGGFVLAANHASGFDVLALAYPLASRRLYFMAKNQLFARPLLGRLVRRLGAFPARGNDPGAGVAAAARLAGEGEIVVIFPTGARRRADRTHRARSGAAQTALEGRVPLGPAALGGTDGWRRLQRWHIAFGPPVRLDDLGGPEDRQARAQGTPRPRGPIQGAPA